MAARLLFAHQILRRPPPSIALSLARLSLSRRTLSTLSMTASSASTPASMYRRTDVPVKADAATLAVDLRSDTVTKPTPEMLQAMISAPVGDDVFGEDPTISLLEETVAKLAGKEAALFCVSGTMGNQLAIRTHLKQPPYTVLCDARAHILNYEASGVSFHCGAGVIPVLPASGSGHLTAADVKKHLVLDDDVHHAPTQLVCLENTLHGSIVPIGNIKAISELARENGLAIHLDGARLWNAVIATGIPLSEYCSHFDSASLCFSKGLGAPVGTVLVGTKSFIKKARHFRKLYGGGWRQAGILANACLYALEHHWPAMKTDHANASFLADSLVGLGFALARPTETNMVWVDGQPLGLTAQDVANVLSEVGVKMFGGEDTVMRWVIHHQVSRSDVERIVVALTAFLSARPKA
ncbi:pyridoxal phosphate-dependent transferase [Entophlyctis helioformis]|nr:pyridoxal phosphate-dependent transferase [Entophlyctis helioformis]